MIFGIAIAFLFIVQGLINASRFIILLSQWVQSQKWHSASGNIIHANLQSMLVPRGGRKGHSIDGSLRLVTAYTPDILYEYRANAASFQSKQIFLGQQFPSTLEKANNLIEKYSKGKKVTVYYNPEKPDFAVLERDRLKELFGHLASVVFFLLFGFAMLIQVIHE